MKALNKRAREVKSQLQALAHVSTDGVSVAILKNRVPECWGNSRINLPECLFEPSMSEQLRRTWRHELQHARDLADGIDLPVEQMEQRARKAELTN